MSVHPTLSMGKLTSASQSLIGQWLYIAPGVAWVNLAVVTTPTFNIILTFCHVEPLLLIQCHLFSLTGRPISQGGHTGSLVHKSTISLIPLVHLN